MSIIEKLPTLGKVFARCYARKLKFKPKFNKTLQLQYEKQCFVQSIRKILAILNRH